MGISPLQPDQIARLAALANGIIPADETDAGAAAVHAGPRIAEKIAAGVNAAIYLRGLETAQSLAGQKYGRDVAALGPGEVHELLAAVREALPGFFKQLRMDVSAMYLGDPSVWPRIGFPGPASEQGGYADFDRPQTTTIRVNVHAKEKTTMPAISPLPEVQAFLAKPARMLIDNQWREPAGGEWIDSLDPATGKPIGRVPAATEADVNLAVSAARRAFKGAWRKTSPYERGRTLNRAAALMEKHADELAQLIALENGKPLWEAKKEVGTAVSWTEYYAGWTTKLLGDTIPVSLPGQFLNYTVREVGSSRVDLQACKLEYSIVSPK